MTLQAYQLTYNGVTIGAGTDVQITSIDGLRELPGMRSGDAAMPRQDGRTAGLTFLDERIVTIGLLVARTTGDWEAAIASVAAAFQPFGDPNQVNLTYGQQLLNPSGPGMCQFQLPGWAKPLAWFGRTTKYKAPIDNSYQYRYAAATVEMTCTDAVLYANDPQSASSGLPSPTSGASWALTWPASWGASSGGGVTVNNAGNYPSLPIITITGPCTSPAVSLGSATLALNLTLGNTDTLVIDMRAGTVVLNGTGLRNGNIKAGSSFWAIPAGTSSIDFSSTDATAVAAQMTVQFLPAYSAA